MEVRGEAAAGTTEQNGSWTVRKLQTLEEAVPLLSASDEFVLGLPVSAVIAQRFRLPSVDPAEFPEMIRLQIEKLLPFPADEVTSDFELIAQNETESVVSAIAIRNEQLAGDGFAAPEPRLHSTAGHGVCRAARQHLRAQGQCSSDLSRRRDARLRHDRERQAQPGAGNRTQRRSAATRTPATAIERRTARHRCFLSKCFAG